MHLYLNRWWLNCFAPISCSSCGSNRRIFSNCIQTHSTNYTRTLLIRQEFFEHNTDHEKKFQLYKSMIVVSLSQKYNKTDVLLIPNANRHTHKQPIFFHMTLLSVEGIKDSYLN